MRDAGMGLWIMRYFFRVEYDGSAFSGWQTQTNTATVQRNLSDAFSTITRQPCRVVGAGRTDAGVHARCQGAHVDLPAIEKIARLEHSVNAVLPKEISIYNMQAVPDTFHARFSARKRSYNFFLADRRHPLLSKRVWSVFKKIDWDMVRQNIPHCVGTHDFTAFCASRTTTENMTCTVEKASLSSCGDMRVFSISADRFIYKMVRSLVGTLIDIGRGKTSLGLDEILKSKNRKLAGETAPACGLVLDYVAYDEISDTSLASLY